MIDFTELSVPGLRLGTRLEEMTRAIVDRLGFEVIEWSGVGPDDGRDLIVSEQLAGPFTTKRVRWLVSCKDRAASQRPLRLNEVDDYLLRTVQHRCEGILLVTTQVVTEALMRNLLATRAGNDMVTIDTRLWDRAELERMLVRPEFADLFRTFLPGSFATHNFGNKVNAALEILRSNVGGSDRALVDRLGEAIAGTRGLILEAATNDCDAGDIHLVGAATGALLDDGSVETAARNLLQASKRARLGTLASVRRHIPQHYQPLSAAIYAFGRRTDAADEHFDAEVEHFGPGVRTDIDKIRYLTVDKAAHLLEQFVEEHLGNANTWGRIRTIERLRLVGTPDQIAVDDVAITRILATDAIHEQITFRADLTVTMSTHHVEGDHPEKISGWCEGRIMDVGIQIEAERFDVDHLIVSDA